MSDQATTDPAATDPTLPARITQRWPWTRALTPEELAQFRAEVVRLAAESAASGDMAPLQTGLAAWREKARERARGELTEQEWLLDVKE